MTYLTPRHRCSHTRQVVAPGAIAQAFEAIDFLDQEVVAQQNRDENSMHTHAVQNQGIQFPPIDQLLAFSFNTHTARCNPTHN